MMFKSPFGSLLIIRQMQIETTMRDHLTPVRMSIINKSTNKCGQGCEERKTLMLCLLMGMQIGAATVESSMEFPQKLKMALAGVDQLVGVSSHN